MGKGKEKTKGVEILKNKAEQEGYQTILVDESTGTAFFRKDNIIFFMMENGVVIPYSLEKFIEVATQFAQVSLYLSSPYA